MKTGHHKVCILSMQRIDNMGSVLQAYSLKRILENIGCDVDFMDIRPNDGDNALLGGKQLDFSSEKDGKGFAGKIDEYTFNRAIIKAKSIIEKAFFQDFRKKYLNIEKTSTYYDFCVIGSD